MQEKPRADEERERERDLQQNERSAETSGRHVALGQPRIALLRRQSAARNLEGRDNAKHDRGRYRGGERKGKDCWLERPCWPRFVRSPAGRK